MCWQCQPSTTVPLPKTTWLPMPGSGAPVVLPSAPLEIIPPDVCAWVGHDYFVHPEDPDTIICRKCGKARPVHPTTEA